MQTMWIGCQLVRLNMPENDEHSRALKGKSRIRVREVDNRKPTNEVVGRSFHPRRCVGLFRFCGHFSLHPWNKLRRLPISRP